VDGHFLVEFPRLLLLEPGAHHCLVRSSSCAIGAAACGDVSTVKPARFSRSLKTGSRIAARPSARGSKTGSRAPRFGEGSSLCGSSSRKTHRRNSLNGMRLRAGRWAYRMFDGKSGWGSWTRIELFVSPRTQRFERFSKSLGVRAPVNNHAKVCAKFFALRHYLPLSPVARNNGSRAFIRCKSHQH
jgi:hypothetical protein